MGSVLGSSRRRFALYYLLSNEYTDIDSLSVQIAAWEQSESVESVDEAERRRVKISLHHNHLPRLAMHDVVEYDARNGDVVRSSGFDEVCPTVERLREADEQIGNTGDAAVDAGDDGQLASNR